MSVSLLLPFRFSVRVSEDMDMRLVQADAPHGANDDYQSVKADSPLARLVEYVEVTSSAGPLGYGSVKFHGPACVNKVRKGGGGIGVSIPGPAPGV